VRCRGRWITVSNYHGLCSRCLKPTWNGGLPGLLFLFWFVVLSWFVALFWLVVLFWFVALSGLLSHFLVCCLVGKNPSRYAGRVVFKRRPWVLILLASLCRPLPSPVRRRLAAPTLRCHLFLYLLLVTHPLCPLTLPGGQPVRRYSNQTPGLYPIER